MSGRLRIIPVQQNPRKRNAKPARARKLRRAPPPKRRRSKKRARAGAGSIASFKTLADAKSFGQALADKRRRPMRITRANGSYYIVPGKA